MKTQTRYVFCKSCRPHSLRTPAVRLPQLHCRFNILVGTGGGDIRKLHIYTNCEHTSFRATYEMPCSKVQPWGTPLAPFFAVPALFSPLLIFSLPFVPILCRLPLCSLLLLLSLLPPRPSVLIKVCLCACAAHISCISFSQYFSLPNLLLPLHIFP